MTVSPAGPEYGPPPEATVRVGDVTISALTDAHGSFTSFREAFPAASPALETLVRTGHPELFSGAAWVLPFRAFLLRLPAATVLVDAGVGPRPGQFLPDRQGWLPAALAAAGTPPDAIELVVLTHSHVDHVGWTVDDAGRPVFPNAHYVLSRPELEFVDARSPDSEVIARRLRPLERLGRLRLVRPDEELLPGCSLIPTPGHTPGHVSVAVEGACMFGDACVHPAQLADEALGYAAEVDQALAAATRSALLAHLARERTLVCAGHFPHAFGYVEPSGSGYRWVDAPTLDEA